jgi:Zn-dependent protease
MDVTSFITQIIVSLPGMLLAITVHEFSHAYVALLFGDPTAKQQGRLTFNPISHLDPFGAIALIVAQIGWAKSVPVDPRNLRRPKQDMIWISLAGPASNLLTAMALALVFNIVRSTVHPSAFAAGSAFEPLLSMLIYAIFINVGLGVFNLLPIHPLDGSKILSGLLPRRLAYQFDQMEQYGIFILLFFIISGASTYIIMPPIRYISSFMLHLSVI